MDTKIHISEGLSPEEQQEFQNKLEAYGVAVRRLSELSPSAGMIMESDLRHIDTAAEFLRYMVVLAFKLGKENIVAGINEKLSRTSTLYWEQSIVNELAGGFWLELKTEILGLFSDLGLYEKRGED